MELFGMCFVSLRSNSHRNDTELPTCGRTGQDIYFYVMYYYDRRRYLRDVLDI